MPAYNVLIMGASYGSLLATKLLFGGHKITMVCLPAEIEAFNSEGAIVRLPVRGRKEPVELNSKKLPGSLRPPVPATSNRPISTSSRWRCRSRNTARRACANCSTPSRRAGSRDVDHEHAAAALSEARSRSRYRQLKAAFTDAWCGTISSPVG